MATPSLAILRWNNWWAWLPDFLREELSPYPGRVALVFRMVVAATLIMIVGMTFRIPYTFQSAIYALMISRESRQATLQSAGTILLVTGIGAAYLLICVSFVINSPLLHFIWVICSFFLTFYAISALRDYTAAVIFAIMISLGVPLWDRLLPSETNVEDTLWLCLSVVIGVAITASVELVFDRRQPGDDVVVPISDRLSAIERLMTRYAEGANIDAGTKEQTMQFAMRGTSLLRRVLRRSDYPIQYSIEMGGVTALVGRLADLAATLTQLRFKASASDQKRLRDLASALANIRNELLNRRIPGQLQFNTDEEPASVPLLREIEHTVSLIPQAFAASQSIPDYLSLVDDIQRPSLLAADAFVNPDHLRFAVKGCLAASICYVIYNAMEWPGISTSVTTCLLTALSTIGSSHQKQILRILGALVGGLVLGMGSQIFILPHLDSIGGFVLLFVAVTALAAWFMTSSPRVSYFGMQIAVAFYLINVAEFRMQTSLEVARDRVVGIWLGLFAMWLIFDQLWGMPAARELKQTFISNLRLLAQFAREPVSKDLKVATARRFALGETINTNLDKVRALADGVFLEFERSREQDLALRSLIRRAQPQMRVVFIMQIAEWKYRVQLPGFELPEVIAVQQREFDDRLAESLDAIADQVEKRILGVHLTLEDAVARLENAIKIYHPREPLSSHFQALIVLGRRIEVAMVSVTNEILSNGGQSNH
jgi:multidrug resistance protein MdtO